MSVIDLAVEKWNGLCKKTEPVTKPVVRFFKELQKAFAVVWNFIHKARRMFLAIPIAFLAVCMGIYNEFALPASVGLFLQESGDYYFKVVRELAVLGPLALTAACLLLLFISKRTLTPWFVSLFSLTLPLIILLTNIYPA